MNISDLSGADIDKLLKPFGAKLSEALNDVIENAIDMGINVSSASFIANLGHLYTAAALDEVRNFGLGDSEGEENERY